MNNLIYPEIKHATRLSHVEAGLINVLHTVKKTGNHKKLGYVSGIITSDGPDKTEENIKILEKYTLAVRNRVDFPIFSGVDVFDDRIYGQLEETEFEREMQQNHFIKFWRNILRSGHITDIFMTPRWDESEGAKDEFDVANEQKIEVHYINEAFLAYE
jgi:hypothetical protein